MMRTGNGQSFGLAARWVMVALGLLSICAGAFLLLSKLNLDSVVRDSINHELGRLASSDLMLHESSEVSIRPDFRVVVADPVFTVDQASMAEGFLTSGRLDATLRVAPLLAGRGEVASLHLHRPHISLDQDGLANSLWSEFAFAEKDASETPANIVVTDGVLDFAGNTSISGLNLSVMQRGTSEGIAINGDFIAGSHRTFMDLQVDDPHAFFSEGGSEGALSLSFDAVAADEDNNPSDDTTDNSLFADLLPGLSSLNIFGPGPLLIDGHFAVTPTTIRLSNATFSKAGITLEGDLTLRTTSNTLIIPGLQTLQVSADAAISDAIKRVGEGNWTTAPITTHWLRGFEIYFDLEGQDIAFGGAAFDTVSVSFVSRNENMSLDMVAQGETLGRIEASAEIDRAADLSMSAKISDASVYEILQPISRKMQKRLIGTPQLPEGILNADLQLAGRGQTLGEVFESMAGSVTASMQDGSLTGADVTATLETLANGRQFMTKEKGPLIPAAGRTQFDFIDSQVGIEAGTARISRLNIAGDRLEIDMLGEVGLKSGAVYVMGNAQLSAAQTTETEQVAKNVDLPFGIGGTLFSPMVAAGVPQLEIAATPGRPGNTIQR
ncbi:AsmA-like C-terminal region-containing protein [uncultured Tateyamaria sp.]|uniref:AsmA family protein n=1 Tax=uncultured Tateyamaria sp. TaxID=455651 RepID=UPI00260AE073|nr:AsmA-like C-terminal region-containing protein [uncultured Tateyamaria sp.]